MDINDWIFLDVLIILINVLFVLYKLKSLKGSSIFFVRVAIFFLLLLFIFPSGLMPVGILPRVDPNFIPRNWYFHLKVGPFGIADIATILFSSICIFNFMRTWRMNRFLLMALMFFTVIFLAGNISAIFLSIDIDYQNLLNSARTFLIIILFFYAGYIVMKSVGEHGIEIMSSCLWVTFILSFVSMILLDSDARAVRYFVPAMLQSQQFVSIVPFLTLYFFIKRNEKEVFYRHFRLWGTAAVMMLFMGYKAFYILILVFIVGYIVSKLRITSKGTSAILLMLFLIISQPFFLYLNFIFEGFNAVDTRAFQVVNSMATLQERGLMSLLFGIGWSQWYTVYFDFPTIDYGAWGANQLASDDAKYSIQLAPFSMIRSIGIVGFFAVMAASIIYIRKISKIKMSLKNDGFILCGIVAINLVGLFSVPDILVEAAAFSAFFCAAMVAMKGNHEAV